MNKINLKSISKNHLIKLLFKYEIPAYPSSHFNLIKNLNIGNIKQFNKIKYAITSNKTIIKSFPTNECYKRSKNDKFNRLNLTALSINSSILILHESYDKKWWFIISELYIGWILKEYAIICSYKEFYNHYHIIDCITTIEPFLTYDNYIIDMGSKFNYVIYDNKTYLLLYTNKGYKKYHICDNKFVYNHMELSKENVMNIALKFLNLPYYLGDDLYKIDCSSYIGYILKTFGIVIPRDTKDIIKYLNINNTLDISSNKIQLLHFKDHIALYLYNKDNRDYYIHANGKYMKVTIDYLSKEYLNYSDIIGVSIIDKK